MKYTHTITNEKGSTLSIKVSVPFEEIQDFRGPSIENLSKNLSIDGFREGKAPQDVVEKHLGETTILQAMAEYAIQEIYPEILSKEEIPAIGQPGVSITKLAEGNNLEFTILTEVLPTITLSEKDCAKAAKKAVKSIEKEQIGAKEVGQGILELRKMRAHQKMTLESKDGKEPKKLADITEEDLEPLTDAWVKELGDFKNVDEFKTKLRENMEQEAENKFTEKRRIAIIDSLLEKASIDTPTLLVQHELERMMHQFEHDVTMQGMTLEKYFEAIGKTREDMLETWKEDAKKRANTHLLLEHIAKEVSIEADKEKLEEEMKTINEQYKDMKEYNEENARAYLQDVLRNQAVFEWLESQI
jgi:FKBP-type peptidyl-prolyl cis-trans isomerase (trigger factor)